MKKTITIVFEILFAVTLFANCIPQKEKDDAPVIALLVYANDQLSGNCASVTKTNSTTYSATLLSVPKGGCSQPGTKEEAVAQTKSETAKLQTIYAKAGSNCNATSTTSNSTANYLINSYNNMTEDQYKATLVNSKMIAIGNLVTESRNTLKNAGRTEEQIAAMKPGSLEDYYTMSAVAFANAATQPGCVTAINNSSSNAALFTIPPTVVALSSCTYGSSQPASTKCATLNTEF